MEKSELINSMIVYLHLDNDEETVQELTAVVEGAIATTINAINSNLTYDDLKNDTQFIMALRTLITQTYYDRELSNGYSFGYLSFIAPLKAEYDKGDADNAESN